jgi:hypothetical protein
MGMDVEICLECKIDHVSLGGQCIATTICLEHGGVESNGYC